MTMLGRFVVSLLLTLAGGLVLLGCVLFIWFLLTGEPQL